LTLEQLHVRFNSIANLFIDTALSKLIKIGIEIQEIFALFDCTTETKHILIGFFGGDEECNIMISGDEL
jgi:hypothetical protein